MAADGPIVVTMRHAWADGMARVARDPVTFWGGWRCWCRVPASSYELGLVLFFFAGLFTSGIYSGYAIYFPELFPTHVPATGAGFCYDVGRVGLSARSGDHGMAHRGARHSRARRPPSARVGAIMGCVYVFGFLVIPFLPETRGVDIQAEG